jgi:hypothetical protein
VGEGERLEAVEFEWVLFLPLVHPGFLVARPPGGEEGLEEWPWGVEGPEEWPWGEEGPEEEVWRWPCLMVWSPAVEARRWCLEGVPSSAASPAPCPEPAPKEGRLLKARVGEVEGECWLSEGEGRSKGLRVSRRFRRPACL